jgi:hypothetical protein
MRRALAGAAILIVWLLVLGAAAGIPLSAPFSPRQQMLLQGADFRPVIGAAIEDGTALGVGGTARDGNALQSVTLESVHAADFPVLRYHFEDFPRTLELSLVFRRADAPGDVQAVLLPWPGDGARSVDLSSFPAWRGDIIELGFAEYATAQLVPPSIAFRPFRLVRARLSSPSWSAVPALLRTAWFGYQPWNLMSISALGPSINSLNMPSMLWPIVAGVLLTLAAVAWLRRWPRVLVMRAAFALVAVAWVVVDLRWLDDLWAKHRLTESIYAGKSWQERARLQPDEDVAAFAQLTRRHLAGVPTRRILVASDSTYTLLRLLYLLLPLDAAPLEPALAAMPTRDWPRDAAVVLCASKRWTFDDATSTLRADAHVIPVTPVFVGGNLGIFRLRGAQP